MAYTLNEKGIAEMNYMDPSLCKAGINTPAPVPSRGSPTLTAFADAYGQNKDSQRGEVTITQFASCEAQCVNISPKMDRSSS